MGLRRYALLSRENGGWHVAQRAVDYDLDRIRSVYKDSGYMAAGGAFVRAVLCGLLTGRNIGGKFLRYARSLAVDAGWKGSGAIPDAAWARAAETFDWPVG